MNDSYDIDSCNNQDIICAWQDRIYQSNIDGAYYIKELVEDLWGERALVSREVRDF